MAESVLISKVEKYLKNIEKDTISVDSIEDFESFNNLYFKLEDRLKNLIEFKDEMEAEDYTAPFRSLKNYDFYRSGEETIESKVDTSIQNKNFRRKANAKKNIYERVKYAIYSHEISIGHLEQLGYVKCAKCYKKYQMSEYVFNEKKCSCGSEEFNFKINRESSYRTEIIPYLPLSGNYMVLRGELSDWGKQAFNKILSDLKQEKKGVINTLSLEIKYKDQKNKMNSKKVNLDSEYQDSYEEEIRRRYGKDVKITKMNLYKTKPAIIDDHQARLTLALAYVRYSQDLVKKIKDSILKRKVSDYQRLIKYEKIKYEISHKNPKYIVIKDLEGWREIEFENELKKLNLMDKYGKLNRSLKRDLKTKETIKKTIFTNIAPVLIKWDIFKYYLTTSKNYRMKNLGPFPYIRVELDRQQRKTFETNYTSVIDVLNEETDIKISSIPQKDLILYEKFKIEKENRFAKMNLNYPALSAALIHQTTDIDIETLGNLFNINDSKIRKELDNIKIIRGTGNENKKPNDLSNRFRDLIIKK